ncbi:unnamed protein product, partial [Gadus morhua 'NCC']
SGSACLLVCLASSARAVPWGLLLLPGPSPGVSCSFPGRPLGSPAPSRAVPWGLLLLPGPSPGVSCSSPKVPGWSIRLSAHLPLNLSSRPPPPTLLGSPDRPGQEVKNFCTPTSDAECEILDGFFCSLSGEPSRVGGGGLEERFRGKWADSRIDQPGTLGEEQETPGDGPGRSRRPQGTAREGAGDPRGRPGKEQETPGDGPGRSRRPQGTAREGAGDPRGRPGKEQETPGDGPGRSRRPQGTAREGAGDPRGRPGRWTLDRPPDMQSRSGGRLGDREVKQW